MTAGRFARDDCRLQDLLDLMETSRTDLGLHPHASRVEQEVLIYDASHLRAAASEGGDAAAAIEADLARALDSGPGIVVIRGAFEDTAVVDRVSDSFARIIEAEKSAGRVAGDHFAKPGANDRIWNALEKLAVDDPDAFVDYYANDMVALAARAWLGPGYQVTSQVNVVNPGGAGQTVHRDYHLGFQSPEVTEQYPAHIHALSPMLTLQGAVAHLDMPLESGPTLYLPHSQKYAHGYLAYWLPKFQEYFVEHHIQLPLTQGDAVFFNPALFHAAGSNVSTDIRRMANLLQISSAFGRAMETVDRDRLLRAVYPRLLERSTSGALDTEAVGRVVAASAEGYAFPTNLDRDPPVDGMTPGTQADLVRSALAESIPPDELANRLEALAGRRATHG